MYLIAFPSHKNAKLMKIMSVTLLLLQSQHTVVMVTAGPVTESVQRQPAEHLGKEGRKLIR